MTDKEKEELWKKYIKTKSDELREQIIIEYSSLVKIIAGRLNMYLGSMVEYDDLVGYGILGLIDSIDRFDTSINVKFETYASIRIRGSIIDQLRRVDWIPRKIREKQKIYNTAENNLTLRLGRKPTDREMIKELGVTDEDYYSTKTSLIGTDLVYIDDNSTDKDGFPVSDSLEQNTFENPESSVIKSELSEKLQRALSSLTDKQRQVIEMYYYNELSNREISKLLEISDSRVSQLHAKALAKLKTHLGSYIDLFYKSV